MPPMLTSLVIVAGLIAITALVEATTRRLPLPGSVVLVLVGAGLAFVPGLPAVEIEPDIVLLLFLPPVLYSAGVGMSWRGFRENLRPILLLAVGCVLFTAAAVAAVGHWLLGLPWAVAMILGAVVSPPDAVAPMAIARRLGLPERVQTILEGEGLVNDATALILFSFSVAAVLAGGVAWGAAVASFVIIVAGEIAWGMAMGWVTLRLRRWLDEPQTEIIISLLGPYAAFWLPHALGGSGVIAAVAMGLYISWHGPRFISPATRLQGFFVWGLVNRMIEGMLFLLTGLQARAIVEAMGNTGWQSFAIAAGLVSVTVIVVRFIWVFPAAWLPRLLSQRIREHEPEPPWQSVFFIGFTGIRGVVSLAAALSIPMTANGAPFPGRGLVLFVSFAVIIVTLVGQGSMLGWLIRKLGLDGLGRKEAARAKDEELGARIEGVRATLAHLDGLAAAGADPRAVGVLRRRHTDRLAEFLGIADAAVPGNPAVADAELQAELIGAERRRILALHAEGRLSDEARRRIEREFDLEEARNRHALASASGDRLSERLADPESEADETPLV